MPLKSPMISGSAHSAYSLSRKLPNHDLTGFGADDFAEVAARTVLACISPQLLFLFLFERTRQAWSARSVAHARVERRWPRFRCSSWV
jgi:hypothetical protein